MPLIDMPLEKLKTYMGCSPKPDDFEAYWDKALADLADECAGKHLKGQEIFFFTNDDAYILVEKRIREKLVNQFGFTDEEIAPLFKDAIEIENIYLPKGFYYNIVKQTNS